MTDSNGGVLGRRTAGLVVIENVVCGEKSRFHDTKKPLYKATKVYSKSQTLPTFQGFTFIGLLNLEGGNSMRRNGYLIGLGLAI